MRPLGVGLVHWPALSPLFDAGTGLVPVLEVEPQTLWEKSGAGGTVRYRVNDTLLAQIAARPQARLVHGVGHPVGGLAGDPLDWEAPLAHCVDVLQPAWTSEHLSFNRVATGAGIEDTSFLLPPRQTRAGIAVAARNLARFGAATRRPVAFETGVNYLQPRADELPDGTFFAGVAQAADCGILLDLHNLWANERNGRQPLAAVLDAMPLDRVWEVHLAGGSVLGDYWLDAHDGLVDERLMEIAAAVVPRLPRLGAIVFEILPAYIEATGLDRIARQLERLHGLWALRAPLRVAAPPPLPAPVEVPDAAALADIADWERAVGALALGRPLGDCSIDVSADAGGAVFEQLVREFRSGRIVRVMRYTVLALLRGRGAPAVDALVRAYCRSQPADLFTAVEAERFAAYVASKLHDGSLSLPWLDEVLAFEQAMVRASLRGEGTTLRWSVDPVALLDALETGAATDSLAPVSVEMVVGAA